MIKKVINKFKNSKIAKNSMWMIMTTVIQMIISLAVNMVVARYLSVEDYGILNYGLSFINFFIGICTLGLNSITIKYLVSEKDEQGKILGTCIVMRLISSILSVIMIMLIIIVLKNDKVIIITTLLQSISLIFESFSTINFWFQHKLQSKYTAIIAFVAYLFFAAYKIILVLLKKELYWFAFSNCVSYIVIAILLMIFYKKQKGQKLTFSWPKGKEMLKHSYHFILSSLMVALYAQTDKIMIGSMVDDISAVGLYSVSTTIINLWSFLPTAIINSFNPVLVEKKKVSNKDYLSKLKQLYSIIFWLGMAYTLFILIFGKLIIIILYGQKYLGGLSALRIAIFGVTFSFIGVVREFWLVCENKEKYAKWFAIIGVVTNIVLNFILIPIIGIVGAAIATAFTQFTTGIIAPLVFEETRECGSHIFSGILFKFYKNKEGMKNE